jgi:hypothetical protein
MVVAVVVATTSGLAFVCSLHLNPFFCKKNQYGFAENLDAP